MYKMECPQCKKEIRCSNLKLYQINFTEAVYLCEYKNCTYPEGYNCIIVNRTLKEMMKEKKTIQHANSEALDLDSWLLNVYNNIAPNESKSPVNNTNNSGTNDVTLDLDSFLNELSKETSVTAEPTNTNTQDQFFDLQQQHTLIDDILSNTQSEKINQNNVPEQPMIVDEIHHENQTAPAPNESNIPRTEQEVLSSEVTSHSTFGTHPNVKTCDAKNEGPINNNQFNDSSLQINPDTLIEDRLNEIDCITTTNNDVQQQYVDSNETLEKSDITSIANEILTSLFGSEYETNTHSNIRTYSNKNKGKVKNVADNFMNLSSKDLLTDMLSSIRDENRNASIDCETVDPQKTLLNNDEDNTILKEHRIKMTFFSSITDVPAEYRTKILNGTTSTQSNFNFNVVAPNKFKETLKNTIMKHISPKKRFKY